MLRDFKLKLEGIVIRLELLVRYLVDLSCVVDEDMLMLVWLGVILHSHLIISVLLCRVSPLEGSFLLTLNAQGQ